MAKLTVNQGFTHAGTFHADDVFSTALLQLINKDFKVIRGLTIPENFRGIIYDIGGGEFDHHMKDKKMRENGIPYAAFGLLWEKFGENLMDEEGVVWFDEHFVQPLDDADNNGTFSEIANLIADFNPTWDSDKSSNEAFDEAVEIAKGILIRKIDNYNSSQKAVKVVTQYIEKQKDSNILILDKCIPWKKAIIGTEIEYVIYPSNRGGYCIQAAPIDDDSMELKQPFPESWRGCSAEELEAKTGIEGFRFCHTSGFLCSADSFDAAIKIAEEAAGGRK